MNEASIAPVRIGLAGLGTVGSGLVAVLQQNGDWIAARLGRAVTVKTVLVRDLKKPRAVTLGPEVAITTDADALVTDPDIDIFDREAVFIERTLAPLIARLPELRVVLEHITTAQAAEFVASASANVAATLTAHHLLMNRNAMLVGGIRPHHYCLPVLKRETHRQALLKAATSGSAKFFLGTDSAPHARHTKEAACGCAGMYTAHAALELYAEAFDSVGALDQLEAFASFNGPDFYRLPRNSGTVTLRRESWTVPTTLAYLDDAPLTPLRAGETLDWKLQA